MSKSIYILSDPKIRTVADLIDRQVISNKIFESVDLILTEKVLTEIAKSCLTEYFYLIISDKEIVFTGFDFTFKPPYWDSTYMHIWNNDSKVRLFNTKEVLKNPSAFTDESFQNGKIHLKNIQKKIYEYPISDIIFLSYDEFTADANFKKLKERFPRAKRVSGVKGIKEAHIAAAKIATTSVFYVVDADAEILPTFHFDYQPSYYDINSAHIWYARNPVNNLEYGYGGIKLFPREKVLSYNGSGIDFTTSVALGVKVIEEVANITHFDTDPFSAWRSAFRECVKLSSKTINGQLDQDTEERLKVWCTTGNGEFGDFSVAGANEGVEFGKAHIGQPDMLRLINDFGWLENKFNS